MPVPYGTAPAVGVAVPAVPPLAMATVPVRLKLGVAPPLEARGLDAVTDVTVPVSGADIVIVPCPLVIVTPVPAVKVAGVRVLPVVLPIRSWPSVYEVCPVPPLATGNVPVKLLIGIVALAVMALAPLPIT